MLNLLIAKSMMILMMMILMKMIMIVLKLTIVCQWYNDGIYNDATPVWMFITYYNNVTLILINMTSHLCNVICII